MTIERFGDHRLCDFCNSNASFRIKNIWGSYMLCEPCLDQLLTLEKPEENKDEN